MSFAVVKDPDGRMSLFVDGSLDMTGDEDAVDERLYELYGHPGAEPA